MPVCNGNCEILLRESNCMCASSAPPLLPSVVRVTFAGGQRERGGERKVFTVLHSADETAHKRWRCPLYNAGSSIACNCPGSFSFNHRFLLPICRSVSSSLPFSLTHLSLSISLSLEKKKNIFCLAPSPFFPVLHFLPLSFPLFVTYTHSAVVPALCRPGIVFACALYCV